MADPFSAWGPEDSGERLYERDSIYRRQKGLEAQELLGKIAMQPDQARQMKSHADLYEAQAGRFKRETAAAERLEAAVAGAELPEDPMEKLYKLSDLAAKSGNLTQSSKMLEAAGALALKGAQAERAVAQAENQQVQAAVRKQDFISNRLSAAQNQQQFNDANAMYEQEFGEASPYRGMPFTPVLAKQIGEGAVSAKDRLTLKLRENEERGRAAGRGIMDRHNRATEAAAVERNRISEERNKAIKKTGGSAGTPTRAELDATEILLKEHLPSLDAEGKSRASRDLASRAKEIRAQNRAIGSAQAIQMAFKEFNELGVFETEKRTILPDRTKYSSGGMSRETAIPMPKDKSGLKKSRFYVTPRGLARWNGEAFDPVTEDEEDDE